MRKEFRDVEPLDLTPELRYFDAFIQDADHIGITHKYFTYDEARALRDWISAALGDKP